uniref:Uncharacterized protein n=1 Tax=Opuntia streptacantha TaxID=393608 RepID=A0A7C9A4L3_OPUST
MRAFSTPPRYRRNKNCSLRSQNTTFVPIKSMILFIASVTVFLIPSKVVANNSSIDSSFMDIVLSSISGVSLSTMLNQFRFTEGLICPHDFRMPSSNELM